MGPIVGAPSPSPAPISQVAPITAAPSPSPISGVAPITAAPAQPAISQVAPITAASGQVPATAPRTGSGYGSLLAQREALRQTLWFAALLALLVALASAAAAILVPDRRDRR